MKNKPDWKNAPKWAEYLINTIQGAWYWADKPASWNKIELAVKPVVLFPYSIISTSELIVEKRPQ